MKQNSLKPAKGAKKKKIIVGRGNGSGHGNFCGRGVKGQNARSGGVKKLGFEGGQTPLSRKMPKLKGFKNPNQVKYQVINLRQLNIFEDGAEITRESLNKKGLIESIKSSVKILGEGELQKKLIVKIIKVSKNAEEKIKKAGGEVVRSSKK